jgi:hypothetical protein
VIEGVTRRPDVLLIPLEERMAALARTRRYEEAALARDRAAALSSALRRQRRVDALRSTGLMRLRLPGGVMAELRNGILIDPLPLDLLPELPLHPPRSGSPLSHETTLELLTVAAWLDREAHRVVLVHCDGPLASAWPGLPSFAKGQRSITAPAWSMRKISARPSFGSAAATAWVRSGEQSAAMVGPEPDSHPHHAPAATAASNAVREPGVSSSR